MAQPVGPDETGSRGDALRVAKRTLRTRLREALRGVSASDRGTWSEQACGRLGRQGVWKRAGAVMLFWPMADELDVSALSEEALRSGRVLALPRFGGAGTGYTAAVVTNLQADLAIGAFGLREPRPECPRIPLNRLDFVLVPGLGFDAAGRRLGRGKGYYDRLLSEATGLACGVGYDFQVVDEVPCGPHDVVLDCLLTPTRWVCSTSRAVL